MASIKGFQLKNVKRTVGREGYGCTATMYLNGKKIGTYADYGDGGCADEKYNSKEDEKNMVKVILDYAKEHPNKFIVNLYKKNPEQYKKECERFKRYYPYIQDKDITLESMASNSISYIVCDFLELLEKEKLFKKYQKQGYRAMATDDETIAAYPNSWSDQKIRDAAKNRILYMSLDDFNIK
jgi:hypothetical protein